MILNLKPFFMTFPTEIEVALCLCKLCFNVKLLMEPLMAKAKSDGDVVFDSTTKFFMSTYECHKESNEYYIRKCVNQKCKQT